MSNPFSLIQMRGRQLMQQIHSQIIEELE